MSFAASGEAAGSGGVLEIMEDGREVRLIYYEVTGSGIGPPAASVEAASILSAPVREVEPPVRKE